MIRYIFLILLYLLLAVNVVIFFYSNKHLQNYYKTDYSLLTSPSEQQIKSEPGFVAKGSMFVRNIPPSPFILGPAQNKHGPKHYRNSSCARFPTIYNIEFSGTIWQVQRQDNWAFYLLGAYWDVRRFKNHINPSIRVLTLMERVEEDAQKIYCQIWYKDKREPIITRVNQYSYIWIKDLGNYVNGELQPYLLNCAMPKKYKGIVPTSVSIVTSPCTNATNNLRVHFNKPKKKDSFAVCVKGLSFINSDWSIRLVEWIELLKIMGVSKIFLYDLENHPNVKKVYQYYEDENIIEVSPLTHPAGIPNEPYLRHIYLKSKQKITLTRKRQQELIPYNDCLYRNMYAYDYIAVLDTDEVILPHNGASNWIEFIKGLEKKHNHDENFPFYTFLDMIFSTLDVQDDEKDFYNIPTYLYMLRHTSRRQNAEKKHLGIKCMYRPLDILTLHHHFPTNCVDKCTKIYVDLKDGYLHHYRTDGPGIMDGKRAGNYSAEHQVWKWKDELIVNANKALLDLGFIS